MKKYCLILAALMACAVGIIVVCDTASGPTPYSVFKNVANSSTSTEIGLGPKTLVIQGSLPLIGTGRNVTITPASNDSFFMMGVIISYNGSNGNLAVTIDSTKGAGAFSSWKVVIQKTDAEVQDSIRQAYTDLKFGMFLHFNMSTFDRNNCDQCYSVSGEWGLANRDPKTFSPHQLDCGQWAKVAKSAGCNYMVLVTKHHDGFCLWPSQQTNYCVKNAGVTRDVVREFVDSARAYGLKTGLYYSIRDLTNQYALSFIKGQLTELLTNYGPIICLWFDGWGWGPGYNAVPYDSVKRYIKSCQPACLIVENNHEFNTVHSEMIEYEMPIDGAPKIGNIKPAEGNEPIRTDWLWFWHPKKECDIFPAQYIVDRMKTNNARNASYLLDLTPDTSGLIPQCQVERMKEVGGLLGVK